MADENLFMLYAFLMGIFITFIYDLFRIFRRVITHNGFWIAVEDLGFWTFSAIAVFLLMYHMSDGTLRWFAVLGALTGMLLYRKTVSKILVKYASILGNQIKKMVKKLLHFIFSPAAAVGRMLGKSVGKAAGNSRRFWAFTKKRLTVLIKIVRMIVYKL